MITAASSIIFSYILVRKKPKGRQLLELIALLGFAVPGTVMGIGYILSRNAERLLMMANETILELTNLVKKFGNVVAVNNLSIPYIKRGEFVTFLGPSGCGKTTLLRMIGGFYYPSAGDIIMHGERINDIPPEKRKTSMVFQNYALFPHISFWMSLSQTWMPT